MSTRNGFGLITRRGVLRAGIAAGACAGFDATSMRSGWAARGGTLRAGITGFNVINTLDPAKATLVPEYYVLWAISNGLVKFNEKMEIVPDLAEAWSVIDTTTIEFKLRQGVKFQDGSEFTADDVKFTLERLQDEKLASPNKARVAEITAIRVTDPLTIQLVTRQPFAPLLTFLSNTRTGTQIVPQKYVRSVGNDVFGRRPVGTGAYKLDSWKPGESVSLVASDTYFVPGQPSIERVEMPLIAEESSGVTALKGGQIDLTSTAPAAQVPALLQDKSLRVFRQPGLNCRMVYLNTRKAPFDDPHFRRAVSLAVDRGTLVKVVAFGEGVPSWGLIPPSLRASYDDKPRALATFNPPRARAELAQSRYGAGTPGVVLTWGADFWKRYAEVFTLQVNQVLGTKLTLEVTEANAVYARLRAGDFQAAPYGWLGLVDPDEYLGDILSSPGWRNYSGYKNTAFDALIEQGRAELDPIKRGRLYRKAEDLMIEDMPVIPAFCSNVDNLASTKVMGFEQLPYSNYGDQFAQLKLGA